MKVLLLCVLLLLPVSAQAIPVAGEYVFTAGPDIAGTFTSTGTALSAWDIQSDVFDRLLFDLPHPQVVSWNEQTDIARFYLINTPELWRSLDVNDEATGRWAGLYWSPDPSVLTASWRVDAQCCDEVYRTMPTVAFALADLSANGLPVQSVPEPSQFLLLGIGLLGLWAWRRRQTTP